MAFGEAFKIAPLKLHHPAAGLRKLLYSLVGAPKGFFINGDTGIVLAQFETGDKPGNVTFQMRITDSATGLFRTLENITLEPRHRDTELSQNGPGGTACKHGAQVDLVAFDDEFSCNCTDTLFTGTNCEEPIACTGNAVRVGTTCRAFEPIFSSERVEPSGATGYIDPVATPTVVAIGDNFRIAPLALLDSSNVSAGTLEEVQYSFRGGSAEFFVNSATGVVVAQFTEADKGKARCRLRVDNLDMTRTIHVIMCDTRARSTKGIQRPGGQRARCAVRRDSTTHMTELWTEQRHRHSFRHWRALGLSWECFLCE